MARYIDADKINYTMASIYWGKDKDGKDIYRRTAIAIEREIDELSAADVVEVVRCKDCVHWGCVRSTMIGGRVGNCYNDASPFRCEQPPTMKPDDFCSYGERKSDV